MRSTIVLQLQPKRMLRMFILFQLTGHDEPNFYSIPCRGLFKLSCEHSVASSLAQTKTNLSTKKVFFRELSYIDRFYSSQLEPDHKLASFLKSNLWQK